MVMTSLEEVDIFKDAMHLVYWRHVPSWLLVRGDAGDPSIELDSWKATEPDLDSSWDWKSYDRCGRCALLRKR